MQLLAVYDVILPVIDRLSLPKDNKNQKIDIVLGVHIN